METQGGGGESYFPYIFLIKTTSQQRHELHGG